MSDFLDFVLGLLVDVFDVLRWWRCCLALIASMGGVVLVQTLVRGDRLALWLSVACAVVGLALGLVWEWRAEDRRPFWS